VVSWCKAAQLILIKVVTCVFVLAADGVDGEVRRGAPFLRQPGASSTAGSGVQRLRCPGAAAHVTLCARPVTVRIHDPVEFSVDVVFSALSAEKPTRRKR
jgi:hypothetical protein